MGCVERISKASIALKIAICILILSVAFAWTSFVTAAWGDVSSGQTVIGWGLWRRCDDSDFGPTCAKLFGWNLQWYRAVQAFSIMGFLSVNVCFFLALLLIFVPSCTYSKSPTLWTCALAFWSALCYLIAISIFGGKLDSVASGGDLGYGWFLALVTLLLQLGVGIAMMLEARNVGAKVMDF